eukprot:GGOE01007946.1.p1 GENE.GGOE01007946.1~~GGOE01007946.1.p1  ORF type:complete len:885 (+),score=274.05 GGOE01007946.1:228-2657(+)
MAAQFLNTMQSASDSMGLTDTTIRVNVTDSSLNTKSSVPQQGSGTDDDEDDVEGVSPGSKEAEELIETATHGALVAPSMDSLERLAAMPTPMMQYGLLDSDEAHLLRLSLWEAAGRPKLGRSFKESDRSTWSMEALCKLTMVELVDLQCYAGANFRSVLSMYINVQVLDRTSTNNMVPFNENFFPVDKSSVRGTGLCVQFRLLQTVFETGTQMNSQEQLQELRKILFGDDRAPSHSHGGPPRPTTSYELTTSPLSAVTLSDLAREACAVPPEATFFAFCHPVQLDGVDVTKALRSSKTKINRDDPFVRWLITGAFVYFDFQFDVIAINALNFGTLPNDHKLTLCLGNSETLPLSAIQPLWDWSRWTPVTEIHVRDYFRFTHFAWITSSEFIGDHIYPKDGGFAYLHRDDYTFKDGALHLTGSRKSTFVAVVKGDAIVEHVRTDKEGHPYLLLKRDLDRFNPVTGVDIVAQLLETKEKQRARPVKYNTPLHIDELAGQGEESEVSEKFVSNPEQAVFAAGASAARGLPPTLGYEDETSLINAVSKKLNVHPDKREEMVDKESRSITPAMVNDLLKRGALWLRPTETAEDFSAEVVRNMQYVLYEAAKEGTTLGNNGVAGVMRDRGHDKWTLKDFMEQEPAVVGQLTRAEVAALRMYTTSTFRVINGPLRANFTPHPLAATTLFISNALKKLRACYMDVKNFQTKYLWRGMRDRTVSEDFMLKGGSELACMSTSSDLSVVASYARSKLPLLFRLKVDSPMELGADLRWLSVFPDEAEVLYPPLTFAKALFKQTIKGLQGGVVVTIKPSFPS